MWTVYHLFALHAIIIIIILVVFDAVLSCGQLQSFQAGHLCHLLCYTTIKISVILMKTTVKVFSDTSTLKISVIINTV